MMDTKKVLTICGILSVILLLLDVIIVEPHGHYFWQTFKGFDVIYGFVGCAAIIVISKKLGKLFIQRDEKYYGGGVDSDE